MSSLKDLERTDLEDVVKVQQYIVGITRGQYPFQHPGGPNYSPGTQYMPNQTEIDFTQKSRTTLYSNFFRTVLIGAFTPYITLRCLSIMQKRIISTQTYMLGSSLGGGFGGMYGMAYGRINVARDYLRLEGSPLATEARYQLWKLNPSHPFLTGFEHETDKWSYSRNDFNDNDNNNDHDDDKLRRNRFYETRNKIGNNNHYNNYDDDDKLRKQKRNRFYETRNKIGSNNNYNNNDDDGFDASEFFESDTENKQTWD